MALGETIHTPDETERASHQHPEEKPHPYSKGSVTYAAAEKMACDAGRDKSAASVAQVLTEAGLSLR